MPTLISVISKITGMVVLLSSTQEAYLYPNYYFGYPAATGDVERYRARGPHIGHRLHLCELVAGGKVSLEELKSMTKDAKFICKTCGRAAAEELHLCDPVPLESAATESKKQ